MAKHSLYWVMPRPYNAVAGNAPATDDMAFRAPDWWTAVFSPWQDMGVGVGILTTALVEGVDFPFEPHRTQMDVQKVWGAKRVRDGYQGAFLSTLGLGIPPNLLMSPSGDPFVVFDTYPFPYAALAWRRLVGAWGAYAGTQAARGSWIMGIPATEYTVPVCQVLEEVQYHLLETPDEGQTWGPLWTQGEVLSALNLRIARFLMETGILVEQVTLTVAAGDTTVALPGDLIQIRRVAWVTGGTYTELPRVDPLELDTWIPTWESTGGTPQVYSEVPDSPLQMRLGPVPAAAGTVDLLYVKAPEAVTANCNIMPIPDEWCWAVKYGVLADLFGKEGEANDPERAAYCEQRYNEGVVLARLFQGDFQ